MEDRGKSMADRMAKSRVSNSNWVGNSMSNWVSDGNWVSNSMDNWVCNSMSNWVSNSMSNSVATRGCVTISGLTLREACSTVVITDTILVIVHWRLSKVWGSSSISSRMGSNKLGSRGTG